MKQLTVELGERSYPIFIGQGLLDLLADPSGQAHAMALTMERLGQGGEAPGLRAARAVLDGLSDGQPLN